MRAASAAASAPPTTRDPSAGTVWRAARAPLAVLGLVLAAALVIAVAGGSGRRGLLDPGAVDHSGSRALAHLLAAQGVDVRTATTTEQALRAAGPGGAATTVLVAFPDLLAPAQLRTLASAGTDLVLVSPQGRSLRALAPNLIQRDATANAVRDPVCSLAPAVRAGRAYIGGLRYDARQGPGAQVSLCYAENGRAPLVATSTGGRTVTVLGDPAPLTNEWLDDEGDAALALGLLGADRTLVWYRPTLGDPAAAGGRESFYSLVPTGWWWALGQVAVAVVLLGLWRARRLGPVVREPLPVVIRATETVEGRARLYRRARARERAGVALRVGSRARLGAATRLARAADPATVVAVVSARSTRAGAEVGGLLYGAPPRDDTALVRLADDLDSLEREVRHR